MSRRSSRGPDAGRPAGGGPSGRWAVFSAMAAVYVAFGVVVAAIPPMVTEVRTDLGLSRGEIGFALGAWALLYVVTAPPAGRLVDRIGLRTSLTLGASAVALSAVVQAAARTGVVLWLAIAIIGVGGPLVSLSAPKLVAVWFTDPAERPLAVGLYTSAPALGGVLALAATRPVLLPLFGGWRSVLLAEAAFAALAALVWVITSTVAPSAPSIPSVTSLSGSVRTLLASPGVRLAMALGMGTFFITQGLAAWLPDILEQHVGLSPTTAGAWAAASLTGGIVARLAIPGLATPKRRSAVMQAVMVVLALALLALVVGPAIGAAGGAAAAVLLGVRTSLNSLVIVVLMEADEVTSSNAGLAYGLWFSVVEIGGALGPVSIGAIGDTAAGFPAALIGMVVVLVAMMLVLRSADRTVRAASQIAARSPIIGTAAGDVY